MEIWHVIYRRVSVLARNGVGVCGAEIGKLRLGLILAYQCWNLGSRLMVDCFEISTVLIIPANTILMIYLLHDC